MENINSFGRGDIDSGINEPQSYPSADGIEVEDLTDDVEEVFLSSKSEEDSGERTVG